MKNTRNLLWGFAVVSILTFSVFSCGNEKQKGQKEKPQKEDSKVVEAPKNIITLEQADAIYANYTNHRIPAIENYETQQRAVSEKFEAARFVDFDYQTIKNYIAFIDQEAAKAGVKKVTKLRLYFANYPSKNKFNDGENVKHPRQNSIFMLPTLAKDNGDYGFYIDYNGKPKLVSDWKMDFYKDKELSKKTKAGFIPNFSFGANIKEGQSLTLNRGNGGPPPTGDFQ